MNTVFNASAGTGKTYQVTSLYEELVLEREIDPCEILLMTFTDNAAAELRMRVAHRLMKTRRKAEQEENHELAERAITAMSHLPSAPIGTIHSFCTRLLREHALEAGLSPGFSVLVGEDHDQMLEQISRDLLLKQLETDSDFRDFCAGATIIGTGMGFGSSVTQSIPAVISDAGSLGISLENAEAMLPEPELTASIPAFRQILSRLRELPKRTADAQRVADTLEQHLEDGETVVELIHELSKAGLKKFGRGKGQKPISDDFSALLESAVSEIKYKERYPAAKAFARYVQSVAVAFRQRKHEVDSVDFDDQLRMAAGLLQSGKAKPEFKYVIVDEVQDTSRIQCDLIQALWDEKTSLVICGDKKQSIYTWRGADPQVMPDLQQLIMDAGGELKNLKTSYRSKAPILDVVNSIFTATFGPERYEEGDQLEANPEFETEGEKTCVEFLQSDCDEEWSRQEKVAAEMEAVANRIQLLVTGSSDWKPNYRYANGFQPLKETNDYRYSDILILLRRTTHQSILEQALRHAGIPYTLGGKGRGLFTRQETRDVSLFLNVITNPKDAFSLIGFLRSPWVGLPDETIAELAWSDDGFSIDHLMANYPRETDVIDRYREMLGTRLASELVRMLIDETGYDALLAGLSRGTQRLANLRKVLDWLRETERGARTTPANVARKLAEQIASPPQVPEAALLDPAQNAVTIMTVHGSKGLTKRVVFLPDISSRMNNDASLCKVFFDERGEPALGVKIDVPQKEKSAVKSPGFQAAMDRQKAVRTLEFINLFYVAMTRARDLVVTSATTGSRTDGWMTFLEPFIGQSIFATPYSALAEAAERPEHTPMQIPTTAVLHSALETIPPPPAAPELQRIPATRLAREQDEAESSEQFETTSFQSMENAAALGSLGHAVLEQLALNNWEGDVFQWLEKLCDEFGASKAEAAELQKRIEQTRDLMIGLTASMQDIRPEFPFVLHEDNRLIDGTIDLLCRTDNGFAIYDYKFTEAPDDAVAEQYRGQMELYRKAAEKVYPAASTADIRLIVVSSGKPRMLSIDF